MSEKVLVQVVYIKKANSHLATYSNNDPFSRMSPVLAKLSLKNRQPGVVLPNTHSFKGKPSEYAVRSMVIPSIVNPQVMTEQRPWGLFERYSLNEPTTVKLIMVEANRRLSLQYHNNRDEFWKVIKGPVEVRIEDKTKVLETGDSILITRKTVHRLGALDEPAIVLEIAYGQFDEEDIVRLEDDHSRQLNNSARAVHQTRESLT
jgi:mannose-6-phosphate isomerase